MTYTEVVKVIVVCENRKFSTILVTFSLLWLNTLTQFERAGVYLVLSSRGIQSILTQKDGSRQEAHGDWNRKLTGHSCI